MGTTVKDIEIYVKDVIGPTTNFNNTYNTFNGSTLQLSLIDEGPDYDQRLSRTIDLLAYSIRLDIYPAPDLVVAPNLAKVWIVYEPGISATTPNNPEFLSKEATVAASIAGFNYAYAFRNWATRNQWIVLRELTIATPAYTSNGGGFVDFLWAPDQTGQGLTVDIYDDISALGLVTKFNTSGSALGTTGQLFCLMYCFSNATPTQWWRVRSYGRLEYKTR